MSRRPSFTESRRRRLALKPDRLDRLEPRNTMTEPISVTGLSISALRGLAQMGIMEADCGNGAALSRARAAILANVGQTHVGRPAVTPLHTLSGPAVPVPTRPPVAGGGGATDLALTAPIKRTSPFTPKSSIAPLIGSTSDSDAASFHGISAPWKPASRAGGGAATAPRGGSGGGTQAVTIALVSGHGGSTQTQQPSAPPNIPGYLASKPAQGSGTLLGNHQGASSRVAAGTGSAPTSPPLRVVTNATLVARSGRQLSRTPLLCPMERQATPPARP